MIEVSLYAPFLKSSKGVAPEALSSKGSKGSPEALDKGLSVGIWALRAPKEARL